LHETMLADCYTALVGLEPENPVYHEILGDILVIKRHLELAWEYFNEAFRLSSLGCKFLWEVRSPCICDGCGWTFSQPIRGRRYKCSWEHLKLGKGNWCAACVAEQNEKSEEHDGLLPIPSDAYFASMNLTCGDGQTAKSFDDRCFLCNSTIF